jgi:hypothetical protein
LRIGDRLDPLVTALGRVAEHDLVPGQADVFPVQGGQAVGSVVLGVALAADPEEAEVKQADRGGEIEHVIVLDVVALLPPARMVEVLPAPGGVESLTGAQ